MPKVVHLVCPPDQLPDPPLFVGFAESQSGSVGVIARRAPLLFPEKDSLKPHGLGEWLGTVARLGPARPRNSADMPPLSGHGDHRINRLGSMNKPTSRRFSLA